MWWRLWHVVVMMRRMVMMVVRRYWSSGLAIWWKFEVTKARATLRSCTMRCRHCFIWFVMVVMTILY